jgi:hypothetical protein
MIIEKAKKKKKKKERKKERRGSRKRERQSRQSVQCHALCSVQMNSPNLSMTVLQVRRYSQKTPGGRSRKTAPTCSQPERKEQKEKRNPTFERRKETKEDRCNVQIHPSL